MEKQSKETSVLRQLTRKYLELSSSDMEITADADIVGKSGKVRKFDFLVGEMVDDYSLEEGFGVVVKDWKASCNIREIKKGARKLHDCPEIKDIIIVSNSFSEKAQNLARREGVKLITKEAMVKLVQTYLMDLKK
ncbi:MAG: restriction endonuclease [Promethearchaeota archaeon]